MAISADRAAGADFLSPRPESDRLRTFAELHCTSNYSFLRGASHPEELVERAAQLGYAAIAITDECSFAGLVKAHIAAKEHSIKLIVGAAFRLDDVSGTLVLLAPDRCAYRRLAALVTMLRRRSPKGQYRAALDDFRSIEACPATRETCGTCDTSSLSIPESIILDNDPQFVAAEVQN